MRLHVKNALFLSDFNEGRISPTGFRKIPTYKISRKSVQWEPSFILQADRQMDKRANRHDRADNGVSLFCENAPKDTFY
jgi:hypothetical protein